MNTLNASTAHGAPRRNLFRLAGATVFGLAGLASAASGAEAATPVAGDGPDWPGKLKGRHRQVVDAYTVNDGHPLAFASAFLLTDAAPSSATSAPSGLRCRASLGPSARFTSIIRYGPRDRTHCSVCDFLESPCLPPGRRHAWSPRYYFAVPKSLTQSLIVGSVAFEEAGAHEPYPAPTPPECVTGKLAVSARPGKRSRTASPLGAVAACTVSVPVPAKFHAAKSWRGIQG